MEIRRLASESRIGSVKETSDLPPDLPLLSNEFIFQFKESGGMVIERDINSS